MKMQGTVESEESRAKNIYWIDDNMEYMFYIVQGTFPKLWNLKKNNQLGDQQIKSKILVFGDAYQQSSESILVTEEEECYWKKQIDNFFYECCENAEGPSQRGIYNTKADLIKDVLIFFNKKPQEDKQKENNLLIFNSVKEIWKDGINVESETPDKTANKVLNELIEQMKKNIGGMVSGDIIGIDLMLLNNDRVSVTKHRNVILSMGLYNALKEKYNCFLYSSYEETDTFLSKWKEIYKSYYDKKEEGIKIYGRRSFQETGNENFIEMVSDLISKKC